MAEGITGEPNEYPAGLLFDYSVWTANTQVDLVNVSWDSDYVSTVMFGGVSNSLTAAQRRAALDNYIDGLESSGIRIDNMTYVKPNQDVLLPMPYNRVNRYNYLRASNPLMPITGDIQKNYYYFILESEMVNPSVTRVRLQLDVWNTYVYDATFGNCYIERGHIGIANENQFDNYGRDYLTVPEGLDIGADYRTIVKRTRDVISISGDFTPQHDIFIVSTVDLLQDPGTEANPNREIGPGSVIQGMPSAATFYVFDDYIEFTTWLNAMSPYPWITEGIISVTVMPKINRYDYDYNYSHVEGLPKRITAITARPIKHDMFTNWRDNAGFLNYIPDEYHHLKKFWTFPYMVMELTTWSATPVALRPEAWNNPDAQVMERANFMPPNQRVQFIPRQYNSSGQQPDAFFGMTYDELNDIVQDLPISSAEKAEFMERYGDLGDDFGEYLDVITQIANFPTLPVVNNAALSYLASNAHSIAYQRQSAQWTQERAIGMAQGQYDIAGNQMDVARAQTDIARNSALAQTASQNYNLQTQAALNAVTGGAASAIGGSAFGPGVAAAGAASGAASGIGNVMSAGLQAQQNDAATAINNAQMFQTVNNQNRSVEYARNTNLDLAQFASKGDYANTIAGINARVQDAAMIQPSISGQFGGDATNLAHGTMEFSLRWKLIDNAALRIIGDYWLRFGYAIRAFIQPPKSLMVMQKFTYWKMTECFIASGAIPENHKQALRGIMQKGVTVYANPADVGVANIASNPPLTGVSY